MRMNGFTAPAASSSFIARPGWKRSSSTSASRTVAASTMISAAPLVSERRALGTRIVGMELLCDQRALGRRGQGGLRTRGAAGARLELDDPRIARRAQIVEHEDRSGVPA